MLSAIHYPGAQAQLVAWPQLAVWAQLASQPSHTQHSWLATTAPSQMGVSHSALPELCPLSSHQDNHLCEHQSWWEPHRSVSCDWHLPKMPRKKKGLLWKQVVGFFCHNWFFRGNKNLSHESLMNICAILLLSYMAIMPDSGCYWHYIWIQSLSTFHYCLKNTHRHILIILINLFCNYTSLCSLSGLEL